MHPTIREGEVIIVRPLKPSDVRVGDIILYRNDGLLLAHRVVKMQHHDGQVVFILRGDAAGSCGDPVELQQMLGKVTGVERKGRKISLDGTTPKLFWMVRRNVSGIKRWFSQKATLIGLRHPRCVRIRSKGDRITGSAPDGLP